MRELDLFIFFSFPRLGREDAYIHISSVRVRDWKPALNPACNLLGAAAENIEIQNCISLTDSNELLLDFDLVFSLVFGFHRNDASPSTLFCSRPCLCIEPLSTHPSLRGVCAEAIPDKRLF